MVVGNLVGLGPQWGKVFQPVQKLELTPDSLMGRRSCGECNAMLLVDVREIIFHADLSPE